jgi:hypothetical protein
MGNNKRLELCGPTPSQSPGSSQSIALFGLGGDDPADAGFQGTSSPPSGQGPNTYTATSDPTSTSVPPFVPASGATTIGDGSSAAAVLPNASSATLDYPGFNIPPGSHITGLTFRVSRTLTGSLQSEKLKYTLPGGQSWTSPNLPNNCSPCDIPATAPSGGEGWRLKLKYTATTGNNDLATLTMDGIAVIVSYVPPGLEPLTPNHGTFIDASPGGSPHITMQMHGTLYAPGVGMGVWDQSAADVIFSRGVVLWTLLAGANPSFTQTQATFQLPGVTSGRLVQFVGQVRPDSSSSWTSVVSACVAYNDNNSSGSPGPSLPGYTLTVKGWTVLRSSSTQAPPCA